MTRRQLFAHCARGTLGKVEVKDMGAPGFGMDGDRCFTNCQDNSERFVLLLDYHMNDLVSFV